MALDYGISDKYEIIAELESPSSSPGQVAGSHFDFDELGKYMAFKIKNKPNNDGRSKFDELCEDIMVKCTRYKGRQYAALALLLYESNYLNSNKGKTFTGWLDVFCKICGQKKPKYKKNQLQEEKAEVGKAFYYLLP